MPCKPAAELDAIKANSQTTWSDPAFPWSKKLVYSNKRGLPVARKSGMSKDPISSAFESSDRL